MQGYVGVPSWPSFAMWCPTLHNTVIGCGSVALHICTMYAEVEVEVGVKLELEVEVEPEVVVGGGIGNEGGD